MSYDKAKKHASDNDETLTSVFERLFGKNDSWIVPQSSVYCICRNECGATATYTGEPDVINKAAKEFYDIHKECKKKS